MSDNIKLIVELPKDRYTDILRIADIQIVRRMPTLEQVVAHGIPLDDVKAEIAEEICLTDNPYTKETKYTIEHLRLLEILDNIGKESED